METGLIVEAMADAADLAAADEAGQGHADGTVITQVGEIVRGQCPTPSSRGDAAQDLLRMSGCGDFYVENNARFFQLIKIRFWKSGSKIQGFVRGVGPPRESGGGFVEVLE